MNIHNPIHTYRLSDTYINGLLQTSKEKCHKITNSIQEKVSYVFSTIKMYSFIAQNKVLDFCNEEADFKAAHHDLKEIVHKGLALQERDKENSKPNIIYKERQLKQKQDTDTDSVLEDIPTFFQSEEEEALRKERQLKREQDTDIDSILEDMPTLFQVEEEQTLGEEGELKKEQIDDSILIDVGKFFKREEQKINSKDTYFDRLRNVCNKNKKIVKITHTIQRLAHLIFSKIKTYNSVVKSKILNLFKKEVDFKACHRDLKEIVHKGLALRELNKENSPSNTLHKERQLKKEQKTDIDAILKDIPRFFEHQEKSDKLSRDSNTVTNPISPTIPETSLIKKIIPIDTINHLSKISKEKSHKIAGSIQNIAHSLFSKIRRVPQSLKKFTDKSVAIWERRKEGSKSNLLHKERQLKKEQEIDLDSILEDMPKFLRDVEIRNFRLKRFG